MNLKKTSLAVALSSAVALPAFADGFVFGAALISQTLDSEITQVLGAVKNHHSASATEFDGELFAGYIWDVNSGFEIGIQAYYDFGGAQTQQAVSPSGSVKHTIDGVYGVSIMPGFKITPNTKIYLDLGGAGVKQTIDDKDVTGSSNNSKSKTQIGYRYGAGLETMIYDNVGLGMYYAIIDDVSEAKVSNTDANVGDIKASPTIKNFGITLAYHFNL